MLDTLREVFELNGFAPIETRAAEPLDELTRKGEIDKEVYVLRRLHAADATVEPDAGALGLHFDLTVPFARYVLENAGKLDFPFRRYQIQKVWRGERPQEGRYREFTQADIDVVARDTLPFHHDVEVARVMAQALARLDFLPPLRLQVNNRKLIEGFYLGRRRHRPGRGHAGDRQARQAAARRGRRRMLIEPGPAVGRAGPAVPRAGRDPHQRHLLRRPGRRARRAATSCSPKGSAELRGGDRGLSRRSRPTGSRSRPTCRSPAAWTTTPARCSRPGWPATSSLGSICSGGRYDSLATDGATTYPGVGISLGVTRLLVPLLARGELDGQPVRPVGGAGRAGQRRDPSRSPRRSPTRCGRAGSPARWPRSAQKYGRQIRTAERRGIPFVWFPARAIPGTRSRTSAPAIRSAPTRRPGMPPDDRRRAAAPHQPRLSSKEDAQ